PQSLLRPGGYGRVRLSIVTAEGALLVPQRAVTELQGSHQVAVVGSNNIVSIRAVTVGDRVGNLWIVTSGLKAGEQVVVEGCSRSEMAAPSASSSARRRTAEPEMSKFFINRPIVAIVISLLTVIVGVITIASLPISQFP